MTRITSHSAEIARQAAATAHKKSAKPRRARPGGQFATLYRGTRFAHGGPQAQPGTAQAQRSKKMAARLARRRRAARGKRGAGSAEGADSADGADDQPDFDVVDGEQERRGRHGGGRGGHGDDREDPHDAEPAVVTFKSGRRYRAVAPIAPQLAEASLAAPDRGVDPRALREACTRELLALQSELAAQPGAGFTARVHAWAARWLSVQQAGVTLPEADPEALRSHAPLRPNAAGATAPLPDAARDFNLLAGLLLRQFDRHRTPRQSAVALDTLRALRRVP
jgi:type III secretion regulatory protein HpaA